MGNSDEFCCFSLPIIPPRPPTHTHAQTHTPAGELQEMPRPVEAARGQDVRAGAGEGRDPQEGPLVSPPTTRLYLYFSSFFFLNLYPFCTNLGKHQCRAILAAEELGVAPPFDLQQGKKKGKRGNDLEWLNRGRGSSGLQLQSGEAKPAQSFCIR